MRADDGGEFWNYVVGAAVGALIGGIKTAVDEIKKDGLSALKSGKTWAKSGWKFLLQNDSKLFQTVCRTNIFGGC